MPTHRRRSVRGRVGGRPLVRRAAPEDRPPVARRPSEKVAGHEVARVVAVDRGRVMVVLAARCCPPGSPAGCAARRSSVGDDGPGHAAAPRAGRRSHHRAARPAELADPDRRRRARTTNASSSRTPTRSWWSLTADHLDVGVRFADRVLVSASVGHLDAGPLRQQDRPGRGPRRRRRGGRPVRGRSACRCAVTSATTGEGIDELRDPADRGVDRVHRPLRCGQVVAVQPARARRRAGRRRDRPLRWASHDGRRRSAVPLPAPRRLAGGHPGGAIVRARHARAPEELARPLPGARPPRLRAGRLPPRRRAGLRAARRASRPGGSTRPGSRPTAGCSPPSARVPRAADGSAGLHVGVDTTRRQPVVDDHDGRAEDPGAVPGARAARSAGARSRAGGNAGRRPRGHPAMR